MEKSYLWTGGGVVPEKPIYREGDFLKRGAWTVCRFKGGGGLARKREVMFLRGGLVSFTFISLVDWYLF